MPAMSTSKRTRAWTAAILLAAAGLILGPGPVWPGALARADEVPLDDPANPRNVRFEGMIIEWISLVPRVEVQEIGDGPHRPRAREVRLTAHVRNLTPKAALAEVRWSPRRIARSGVISPGETGAVTLTLPPEEIPYDTPIEIRPVALNGEVGDPTDLATLHHERTMRVGLLLDRATARAGDERFGSFVRRVRESLEDLHALFESAAAGDPAAILDGEAIRDRFRIDGVHYYDAASDPRPDLFDDHRQYDVVVACNEGGPLCCFWLPAYSVGHNYLDASDRGLWSSHGEQALWHELLHFRGVPDYYIHRVPEEALPGRARQAHELMPPYRRDIMNDPYGEAWISPLTARIVNSKFGVSRVGACEDTENPYGHVWNWIPDRLRLHVDLGGEPLAGADVRWWRSRPGDFDDGRLQGVAADRPPDGSMRLNRLGEWTIHGDYLGALNPRHERSLWLLFEIEHRGETRFGIVPGLWLNEAWAAGHEKLATWWTDWEALTPVAGDDPEAADTPTPPDASAALGGPTAAGEGAR